MTEKKAVSKTNAKPNFFVRFGKGCAGLGKKVVSAFKKMWHELGKVTWPTREKLVNYSTIVVLFIVFMMVVIGLLDLGASQLVNLIMSL